MGETWVLVKINRQKESAVFNSPVQIDTIAHNVEHADK